MGHIVHHAIIVTSSREELFDAAYDIARKIFPYVSPIAPSGINAVRSFFIPPDGSQSGWEGSEAGDARRDEFVQWLEAQRHSDRSSGLKWVEVSYGEDDEQPDYVSRSVNGSEES